MDPKLVAWFTFFAIVIGACVSVFRADNTALPWEVSTPMRASIALALGAVQACLMAITSGTPWLTAVGTACASVIVAFAAHGAPHVPVDAAPVPKVGERGFAHVRAILFISAIGVAACVVLPFVNGCAWWQHGGEAVVVTELEKVIAEALQGKSAEDIARDLGIDLATVLADLLKSGQKVAHTRAYRDAVHLHAAMVALPAPAVAPVSDGGQ